MKLNEAKEKIEKTLLKLGWYDPKLQDILLKTMATESFMGEVRHQIGGGPALGILQMEPDTHKDIWDNWLRYRPELAKHVLAVTNASGHEDELVSSDEYSIALAAVQYRRYHYEKVKDDWETYSSIWNRGGKATKKKFKEDIDRYIESAPEEEERDMSGGNADALSPTIEPMMTK